MVMGGFSSFPNNYIVIKLSGFYNNIRGVWLTARNDAYWYNLANCTVYVSNTPTLGVGDAALCARAVGATGQASLVKVACPPAYGGYWRYVFVQRLDGFTVGIGLSEVAVMGGGGCMAARMLRGSLLPSLSEEHGLHGMDRGRPAL